MAQEPQNPYTVAAAWLQTFVLLDPLVGTAPAGTRQGSAEHSIGRGDYFTGRLLHCGAEPARQGPRIVPSGMLSAISSVIPTVWARIA